METIFKTVVKVELASIAFVIILAFSGYTTLTPELIAISDRLIEENSYFYLLMLPVLILWIVSCILLLKFKSIGKSLYLFSFLVGTAMYFGLGPQIYDELTSVFGVLSSAVSGSILTFLYLTPISEKFNK